MKFRFLLWISLFASQVVAQNIPSTFLPENFNSLRIAHRGGYAFGPENTLQTICNNIRTRNIKAMEIDLRMTSDGYLVLFHDDTLSRTLQTDRNATVSQVTLAELQSYPLRDTRLGQVYVTEFGQLVDTLMTLVYDEGRDFMLELDFKPHGKQTQAAVARLLQGIQQRSQDIGDTLYSYFFVSTFYPEVLKEIRKQTEKPVLAFSVNQDSPDQVLLARLAVLFSPMYARKNKCAIIEPNTCWVSPKYVERWTKKGYLINTYTANTACEKAYIEKLGIAYTTNCPDSDCQDDPSDSVGKKRRWCKACKE